LTEPRVAASSGTPWASLARPFSSPPEALLSAPSLARLGLAVGAGGTGDGQQQEVAGQREGAHLSSPEVGEMERMERTPGERLVTVHFSGSHLAVAHFKGKAERRPGFAGWFSTYLSRPWTEPRGSRAWMIWPQPGQRAAPPGLHRSMETNSRQAGQQPHAPLVTSDVILLLSLTRSLGSGTRRANCLAMARTVCHDMARPQHRPATAKAQ
jgi:hypothetical protein